MLNYENIKHLAGSTPTASYFFKQLEGRERNMSRINVPRFKKELRAAGCPMDDKDFYGTLEALEKEQVGKIVRGPRGGVRHFALTGTKLKDLAYIAKNGKAPDPIVEVAKAVTKSKPPVKQKANKPGLLILVFLQGGGSFSMTLPAGITSKDREVIANAIRTV